MKKRFLFIFLVGINIQSFGQMLRRNIDISFSTEPIGILNKEIFGWVLTTDGHWKGTSNTIEYPMANNNDKDKKNKRHSIGQDNFESIQVFDALINHKRYWIYVKFFKNGNYKYATRQKGWKKRMDVYYYIVDPFLLPNIQSLNDNEPYVFFIPTVATGQISNVKQKEIIELIHSSLEFPLKSDRLMTFHLRVNKNDNKAQFMICSLHKFFKGTDGIIRDYRIKDHSIYGKKSMFDHLYYESTYLNLLNVLPLTTQSK